MTIDDRQQHNENDSSSSSTATPIATTERSSAAAWTTMFLVYDFIQNTLLSNLENEINSQVTDVFFLEHDERRRISNDLTIRQRQMRLERQYRTSPSSSTGSHHRLYPGASQLYIKAKHAMLKWKQRYTLAKTHLDHLQQIKDTLIETTTILYNLLPYYYHFACTTPLSVLDEIYLATSEDETFYY